MLAYSLAAGAALLWARAQANPINGPLTDNNVFDYIVVGGGASGLTVASRLTEDPTINVLVIEVGQADDYPYQVMIPAYQGQGGTDPTTGQCGWLSWCDQTVPQTNLNNRNIGIPQGKGLGGGTLINGMLWNRGDQDDYNDWATLGNEGWDWNSMLPYFERSETFNPEPNAALASYYSIGEEQDIHGFTGPQNVSFPAYFYNASNYMFSGMQELNIPIQMDPNDASGKGAMFLPQSLSAYNQSRADARRARYDPNANRTNFYVTTGMMVTRILFDGGCAPPGAGGARAVGVEAAPSDGAATWTAVATREVILAAGAIRTPQLLELSGIGDNSSLQTGGVQSRISMPGVGNNLQDHALMHATQRFNNTNVIYPNIFQNSTANQLAHTLYYANRTGPLTFGPPDGNAFLALPQFYNGSQALASQEANYTDDQYLAAGLDPTVVHGYSLMRPLLNRALTADNRSAIEYLQDDAGGTQISNMRPFTRGNTHIISNDSFTYPHIDFRYISNPVDAAVLLQSLYFNDALFQTNAVQDLIPDQRDPVHDAGTDGFNSFIYANLGTEYHPSGSAAMLPYEAGGVVDSNLLVYNTTNLRIVDASIMPMVPAAHLQSVVYAIAEKASDIIKAAQPAEPAVTPTLPLDTTSCNVNATNMKRAHAAGPHDYPAHVLDRRQASPTAASPASQSSALYKYGPANPAPLFAGRYPLYDVPLATETPGVPKAASEGAPTGAALDWTDQLLADLPDVLEGTVGSLVGGLLNGAGGLLNGQGPLGL